MSISCIIRLNLQLVITSQFFQQFKFDICHKSGKEHIMPDILSGLVSVNIYLANSSYSELDALFVYNIMLIEIHPTLISRILARYNKIAW